MANQNANVSIDLYDDILSVAAHLKAEHMRLLVEAKTKDEELETLAKDKENGEVIMSELQSDNKRLLGRVNALLDEIQGLQILNADLESKNLESYNKRQKTSHPSSPDPDNQPARTEVAKLQTDLAKADETVASLESQLDRAIYKIGRHQDRLAKKATKNSRDNNPREKKAVDSKNLQAEPLPMEVTSRPMSVASSDPETTQEKLDKARKANSIFGKQLTEANMKLITLQAKVGKLEAENASLKEGKAESNEQLSLHVSSLQSELEKSRQENSRLANYLSKSIAKTKTLTTHLNEAKYHYQRLRSQLESTGQSNGASRTDAKAAREEVERLHRLLATNHAHYSSFAHAKNNEVAGLQICIANISAELMRLTTQKDKEIRALRKRLGYNIRMAAGQSTEKAINVDAEQTPGRGLTEQAVTPEVDGRSS